MQINYGWRGLIAIACLSMASGAWAIKKCQDSDGNWHYGDFAGQACSQSKVTTLNERGVVQDERAAPLTAEEKAAQAEQLRLEKERLAAEEASREERARILSIYETEADIERQRTNQMYSVQSNIDVTKAYIDSLQERINRNETKIATITNTAFQEQIRTENAEVRSKIDLAEEQLADLLQQKIAVQERFAKELELYRELRARE